MVNSSRSARAGNIEAVEAHQVLTNSPAFLRLDETYKALLSFQNEISGHVKIKPRKQLDFYLKVPLGDVDRFDAKLLGKQGPLFASFGHLALLSSVLGDVQKSLLDKVRNKSRVSAMA